MNQRVARHLLQVFLIPAAGIGLAWYGNQLPVMKLGNFDPVEWSVLALLLVGALEFVCWKLDRLHITIVLGLGMLVTIVALPLHYYTVTSAMPAFGTLLDFGVVEFSLFIFALVTLRYRFQLRVKARQINEWFFSVSGRFE